MDKVVEVLGVLGRCLLVDEVERYRAGEGKVLGFLMGRVMGASKGSADPKLANEALRARLSE